METNSSFLQKASKTHIDSFNYVINAGLYNCCMDVDPVWTNTTPQVKISICDADLTQLQHPMDLRKHKRKIYPAEVRMRKSTYYAEFRLKLQFETDTELAFSERIFFVPLMVKSNLCYLDGMDEFDLVNHKEDICDPGGYFIINGVERIFRQFFVPKRDFPIAVIDNKFKKLRKGYTAYGILVRSVKCNHTSKNVYLHYTKDNAVDIRIFYKNKSYYLPFMLVMKALFDSSDAKIVEEILKLCAYEPTVKHCLLHMLRNLYNFYSEEVKNYRRICTKKDARIVIGNLFSPCISAPFKNYGKITKYLFRKCLLIHLRSSKDKFYFLSFAFCKLLSLVKNKIKAEDPNNPVFQEVLTTGQSYLIVIKNCVSSFLDSVKRTLSKEIEKNSNLNCVQKCTNRAVSLTPNVKLMLATGQIPAKEQGLSSNVGYTVLLLRGNIFATAAQFLGVYKFSAEFYSNSMRKFYPESWGFLCPAQTPEGEHTGLYNYLASECQVVDLNTCRFQPDVVYKFGAVCYNDPILLTGIKRTLICIDGNYFAWIQSNMIEHFLQKLKHQLNICDSIPTMTEIVYIREKDHNLYPGIYIFSAPCRFVRKIKDSTSNCEKTVGMFEQLFWNISEDQCSQLEEFEDSSFLSISASIIPFSENNPSTRNIFSCVKSRQAIGFPFTNLKFRSDTKIAQLVNPQVPVLFTETYERYNLENYPIGTNLIIAVISYSGYDMEDSIVLNKASLERGLMQDMVHKTIVYDFEDLADDCQCNISELCFQLNPEDPNISEFLDPQGLPNVGDFIYPNDPILSVCSSNGKYTIKTFHEKIKARIEEVRFLGVPVCTENRLPSESKKISITYCMKRIPEIGDKFSNHHGQKGVCGFVMNETDLPFSESGIVPDILFNPHGLPTRMSIGMMLEIIATKSSLLNGEKCCVLPFEFTDKDTAIDRYGNLLEKAGFDYYGTEKFYSGTSGEELEADIFCGSTYYFRLHHIVEEKYQVESVNEIDPATRQPINMHSGAVRFGEMERDAILSHGAIQLTLDRLLHNSDKCFALVCSSCETVLCPLLMNYKMQNKSKGEKDTIEELKNKFNICRVCKKSELYRIRIPHVLYYLIIELSSVGIKVKLCEAMHEYSNYFDCIVND